MRHYPFTSSDQNEIVSRYEKGETIQELYREFRSSTATIWKLLRDHKVAIRPTGVTRRTLELTDERQAELKARIQNRESQPRIAAAMGVGHNTVHKWLRQLNLLPGHRKGKDHHLWRDGIKHRFGYRLVTMAKDDPLYSMATKNGIVMEHRLVLARHLGRPLHPNETVHHINGNREDNRVENLQVRHQKHGTGVALICACCGSRNIAYEEL